MTDAEAVEELAKALDHISRVEELVESGSSEIEVENLREMCDDVIDGLIGGMAEHRD